MVIAFEGGLSPLHVLAQFLKLMTSLLFTKLVIARLVVAHMSCTLIWRHDRRRAANLSPTKKVLTRMGTVRYKMRGLDFKPLLLPKWTCFKETKSVSLQALQAHPASNIFKQQKLVEGKRWSAFYLCKQVGLYYTNTNLSKSGVIVDISGSDSVS